MRSLSAVFAMVFLSLPIGAAAQDAAVRGTSSSDLFARRAITALVARDIDMAVQVLDEATAADPRHSQLAYLLGEAHRMAGRFDQAAQHYRRAIDLAGADAHAEARARIGLARTFEAQREHYPDAREAWIAYVRFAESHPDVPSAEVARARIQALDLVAEQDAAYPEVRRRIDARAASHPSE